MKPKVGILTHRDTDGVCAAALAKAVYPEAGVEFAEPYELVQQVLNLPPSWELVVIADLGISLNHRKQAKHAFKEASKRHEIIYVDHHYFPPGINRRTLACKEIVHRVKVSASELALERFKPPRSLEFVAVLGAVGDYQEHTPRMKGLLKRYGWRRVYMEEFLLEEALEAARRDHEFKRGVVKELAEGLWPSDISGLMEKAREGARRARMLERHVERHARRIGDNVVLVPEVPFGATGPAAEYAFRVMGVEVGIATHSEDDHVRLSIRRSEGADVNLNLIISRIALEFGGSGGGHEAAVGGRIPAERFSRFLDRLKRELVQALKY